MGLLLERGLDGGGELVVLRVVEENIGEDEQVESHRWILEVGRQNGRIITPQIPSRLDGGCRGDVPASVDVVLQILDQVYIRVVGDDDGPSSSQGADHTGQSGSGAELEDVFVHDQLLGVVFEVLCDYFSCIPQQMALAVYQRCDGASGNRSEQTQRGLWPTSRRRSCRPERRV